MKLKLRKIFTYKVLINLYFRTTNEMDNMIYGCNSKAKGLLMQTLLYSLILQHHAAVGLGLQKLKIKSPAVTIPSQSPSLGRRDVISTLLLNTVGMDLILNTQGADAAAPIDEGNDKMPSLPRPNKAPRKPFAPAEALLPPARVKLTIDNSLVLTDQILALSDNDITEKERILNGLKEYLLDTKTFMVPRKNQNSSMPAPSNENLKLNSNTKLYDETYNEKLKNVAVTEVPLALLTKAGDYRQFNLLQKRQRKLEKLNPIREAFNFYTRQLQFDTEYYVLNVDADVKKKMIRNDNLPDIKSVIVSDLDLRDLVRNQVLDAFDDVKAEFAYQMKNYEGLGEEGAVFDGEELRTLLIRAQDQCDQWFDFISIGDVEIAMSTVREE